MTLFQRGPKNLQCPGHRVKPLVLAMASLMAIPVTGYALGLGPVQGEPTIGEQLQLEVPVTGTIDRAIDNDCVSVRRQADSLDSDYFPRDISARVQKQGKQARLVLTTRSPLRQPLVEFRLTVTCGYNLSHDYLLMASPPAKQPSPAVESPASVNTGTREVAQTMAVTPPQAQAGTDIAVPAKTMDRPSSAESGTMPDGVAAKEFVASQNMTLEQVARLHFPGPLRQERFMRWVYEANPKVFAGAPNLRRFQIQAGQQLLIPEGVPPRRPGDHQNGPLLPGEKESYAKTEQRKKAAVTGADASVVTSPTPKASADTAKPAHSGAKAAAPASSEPPVIASGSPLAPAPDNNADRLVVGTSAGIGTSKDIKETVVLVDRLMGAMRQQVAAQTSSDEKIVKMEAEMAELGKYIAKLESDIKQRDAGLTTEIQAVKAVDEDLPTGWLQLLLAIVAGGVAGFAVPKLVSMLGARRGASAKDDAEPLVTKPDNKAKKHDYLGRTSAGQELEPGPMTELGWDAEAEGPRTIDPKAQKRPSPAPKIVKNPPKSVLPVRGDNKADKGQSKPDSRHASQVAKLAESVTASEVTAESKADELDNSVHFLPPDLAVPVTEAPQARESRLKLAAESTSDPSQAAIELANIMTSMGLADSAAQTLVDHIQANPRQSLPHWLKLLELHRRNGNREEFERSANEMRTHFNVKAEEWGPAQSIGPQSRDSLENYPHICAQIVKHWQTPDCLPILQALLADNREGTRVGFPLAVAEEILLLVAILSSE